jgi:hypothetical protein
MEESGFQVLANFISSKEDRELYARPVYTATQEIIKSQSELVDEIWKVVGGYKAECDAVGHEC